MSVVVLTIAHIDDPDPMNCDYDNLKALCQGCHNRHDMPMRVLNRILNRGQLMMRFGNG
jgi:5-methylcytosine-specific restriction endonuclease McrA